MTPPQTPTDLALARFVRGESSSAERQNIQAWIATDPEAQRAVDAIASLLIAPPPKLAWDIDAQWTEVRASIEAPAPANKHHVIRVPRQRNRVPWRVLGLCGVAAAGAIAFYLRPRPKPAPVIAPAFREYTTRRGERASILLADGSRVTLAPQSIVRIPDDFGRGRRRVDLVGEAVFTVKHDSGNAFRVHTLGTVIEDIGTKFDVRSYAEEGNFFVAVADGSVSIADSGRSPTVLQSGWVGTRGITGKVRVLRFQRLARYFEWTNNHLVFENESMDVVLRDIGRWYDLNIRVVGVARTSKRVTADFSTQQPRQMIEALATALDAHVVRDGRIVTLTASASAVRQ